jgi:hypothetical protein
MVGDFIGLVYRKFQDGKVVLRTQNLSNFREP